MNRTFLTAPIALAVSALFISAAAGPAEASETPCTVQAAELRSAAAGADAATARQALRHVSIAAKLCDAGNERAAEKKFAAASRILGESSDPQLAAKSR